METPFEDLTALSEQLENLIDDFSRIDSISAMITLNHDIWLKHFEIKRKIRELQALISDIDSGKYWYD